MEKVRKVDASLSRRLYSFLLPQPSLWYFWEFVAYTNDGFTWFLFYGPLMYLCRGYFALSTRYVFLHLFAYLVVDLVVVGLIKTAFKRVRPHYNTKGIVRALGPDAHSFPSGHSARTMFLVLYFTHYCTLSPSYTVALCGWGAVNMLSRLALGRHYISDVLAGIAVGCAEFGFALLTRSYLQGL